MRSRRSLRGAAEALFAESPFLAIPIGCAAINESLASGRGQHPCFHATISLLVSLARFRRLQEHVPLPPFLRPRFVWRVERHHWTVLAAVGRPMRQAGAIGISGRDEIDPRARRELRQLAVCIFVQPREGMKIVEHIEKLARMKGAGVAAVALAEPALRS